MAKRILRRLPVPAGTGSVALFVPKFPELPRVICMGLSQSGRRWSQPEHAHDVCEVHFVRCGSGTLIFRGKRYAIKTGDVYAFRPAEFHGGITNPVDPAQVLFVQFVIPPSLQPAIFGPLGKSPVFSDEDATELRSTLQTLADELAMHGGEEREFTKLERVSPSLIARTLHVLGALIAPSHKPTLLSGTPRERELAEQALRRIEGSRLAQTSLRRVAHELGVSPAYLGTSLRAATGKTFPQLLGNLRILRARQLLADPSLPVREVACSVGLASPRALVKLFRRLTGKTPNSFRP